MLINRGWLVPMVAVHAYAAPPPSCLKQYFFLAHELFLSFHTFSSSQCPPDLSDSQTRVACKPSIYAHKGSLDFSTCRTFTWTVLTSWRVVKINNIVFLCVNEISLAEKKQLFGSELSENPALVWLWTKMPSVSTRQGCCINGISLSEVQACNLKKVSLSPVKELFVCWKERGLLQGCADPCLLTPGLSRLDAVIKSKLLFYQELSTIYRSP